MKKTLLTAFILFFAILSLSGCTAGLTEPELDFEPPKYVEEMPAREDKKDFTSTGSIFGQGDNPLFSDHKAMNLNDIVTVVISETAQSSNTGAKQLSEIDTSTLGGGVFTTGGATTGTGVNGTLSNAIGSLNGYTNAGFNTNSVLS